MNTSSSVILIVVWVFLLIKIFGTGLFKRAKKKRIEDNYTDYTRGSEYWLQYMKQRRNAFSISCLSGWIFLILALYVWGIEVDFSWGILVAFVAIVLGKVVIELAFPLSEGYKAWFKDQNALQERQRFEEKRRLAEEAAAAAEEDRRLAEEAAAAAEEERLRLEEESTKTPHESSSGNQTLINLSTILFPLALFAILFLPIAPIESDITSIPGHNWIMSEGAAEDWKNDEISDQSQFRRGLFFCFCLGLFGMMIGGLIGVFGGDPGAVFGGLVAVAALFGGTVMWLWGTLALGFFEILAGNPYWIADLAVLFGSFIVQSSNEAPKSFTTNSPQEEVVIDPLFEQLPGSRDHQCNAKTRRNRRCVNDKSQGSDYCGVHRCRMYGPTQRLEYIQMPYSYPRSRCVENNERGSKYCLQHGGDEEKP